MRLSAQNLSFSFEKGHKEKKNILSSLDFTLNGGEILGIIGANGSGKTTLLKILSGVIKPTSGAVFYHDKNIEEIKSSERGKIISYIPQKPALPYGLTVREIIELGRLPYRYPQTLSSERAIISRILAETELSSKASSFIETLSEGEKARVFLARGLAAQTPLLFIDEPGAFLDPSYNLLMMTLLKNEAFSWGGAIAIILHDLAMAGRFCTKLLLLHKGEILAYGSPQEVLVPEILAQAYRVKMRLIEDIPLIWERL